jgi:hypothetical protein
MVASGMMFLRRGDPFAWKLPWAQRLHYFTGYALMAMFTSHVTATRILSMILGEHYEADYTLITCVRHAVHVPSSSPVC